MFWTASFTMFSKCDYLARMKQFPDDDFQNE